MKKTRMRTRTTNKSGRITRADLLWLLIPLGAVLAAWLLCRFVIVNALIPSESMEPTYGKNAIVIGSRLAYGKEAPKAGDIVFFRNPALGDMLLVKRVIAVEGQTFSMKDGRVYIDGVLSEEPYVADFGEDSYPPVTVPEGAVFLLGDNRTRSKDSRCWEEPFLPAEQIVGKAVFTVYAGK